MTRDNTHDNDDDSWSSLGLHAQKFLIKIDDQQSPRGGHDTNPESDEKKKQKEHADAVSQRLRDIDRFEQRYRGRKGRE